MGKGASLCREAVLAGSGRVISSRESLISTHKYLYHMLVLGVTCSNIHVWNESLVIMADDRR